jgi:hypothetical protein
MRVDDFVSRGVVKDGLGVNTSLVSESAEASNVVVERNVDFNTLGNKILNLLEHMKLVFSLDVLRLERNVSEVFYSAAVIMDISLDSRNDIHRRQSYGPLTLPMG